MKAPRKNLRVSFGWDQFCLFCD